MKIHATLALIPFLSIATISPVSAALRGNGKGDVSDKKNDLRNGKDRGYKDFIYDIKIELENGKGLGTTKAGQLKQKFKQERLKTNGKTSKSLTKLYVSMDVCF